MSATRIALAQINPTVGDLDGNVAMIERWTSDAVELGADLVAFPELAITGYPPEDLVLKPSFISDNLAALDAVATATEGIVSVVGFVEAEGDLLFNSAALIAEGKVRAVYRKHHLPNYGVFDEQRYFEEGEGLLLGKLGDLVFGVTVCEDLWRDDGPHAACAAAGARLIVNINASPYHMGKGKQRKELLRKRATSNGVAFAYVNMVGGQDELVFDGQSSFVGADGSVLALAEQFRQQLLVLDYSPPEVSSMRPAGSGATESLRIEALPGAAHSGAGAIVPSVAADLSEEAEVYSALVLGVQDYIGKIGFQEAVIGISGGIDSALTACIAADALGPDRVMGVSNPSEYTSRDSESFAAGLAGNLGIRLVTLPIADIYEAILKTLDPVFAGTEPGLAEENVQARIRGNLWMAISNKFPGLIVLSCGNKSEMSVGYATLYGDMAGGFAVLKDVPKTLVYRLARWRNRDGEVIPSSIIERPPTAELRPDQLDTDALPPYEVLDPILEAYVEDDLPIDEIVAKGFDEDTVRRVARMVDVAEYKRRQAPPGIKITDRAFGRDRRLPIANRYWPYLKT